MPDFATNILEPSVTKKRVFAQFLVVSTKLDVQLNRWRQLYAPLGPAQDLPGDMGQELG